MLTIAWLWIKGAISKLIPFIIEHWRVVLLVLMVLAIFYYKTRYEAITSEFEAYKQKQIDLVNQLNQENKAKDNLVIKNLEKLASDYQANIVALNLDREKIKKGLQNEINRTSSLLNDVRVYQNRASGAGLPKDESAAIISTEERTDCNATIAQLIDAGKSCATDYNTLYDAWMIQCDTYGCD